MDLASLRDGLVEQVRARLGDTLGPAVAEALRSVPRHLFLPGVPPETAYADDAIVTKYDPDGHPISSSSQPTIMAIMLGQLGLAPGQRVLEIGAGTGYNAALMAHLVAPGGEVVSVDIDLDLVTQAQTNLASAECPHATVSCADGADGYAARAPYDRIIATVGVWDLAPAWLDQLAPDGRLVVPLDVGGVQRSVAFERASPQTSLRESSGADGHWVSRSVVPCGFMRLRGELAGPEQTFVLDSAARLSVMVPNGGQVSVPELLTALAGPSTVRPTQVTTEPAQIMRDLGLWLAIKEPRWCMLSELDSAAESRLAGAPLRMHNLRFTTGVQDGASVAMLTCEPGDGSELVAVGYGANGDALTAELAAQVRAWDAAGRPGDQGLHIDAYVKSTLDIDLSDRVVIDKTHTVLALSWPQ